MKLVVCLSSFVSSILFSLSPRQEGGRPHDDLLLHYSSPNAPSPSSSSQGRLPSFLPSQYTRRFKVGDNDAITAITKVGRVELHTRAQAQNGPLNAF